MSPALIAAIIALIQEAITLEPQIAAELSAIFALGNPSPADWEALRAKVLAKSYTDYVPATMLPPSAVPILAAIASLGPVETAPISQTSASTPAPALAPQPPIAPPAPQPAVAKPSPYLVDGTKNPAYVD